MDPDSRPEMAPITLTLRDNFAKCDTPFFSEQFTLPVQRNFADYKTVLCHPGSDSILHDQYTMDNGKLTHENRAGWGSENFFQAAERSGNLRIKTVLVSYQRVGDSIANMTPVEATVILKGPSMDEGARPESYSFKQDKAQFSLNSGIIAECPGNPALEGTICVGHLTRDDNKEFFVAANRTPSIQIGPDGKSGIEIMSKILKRNGFKRAASTVELTGSFTRRLRDQVDKEFEHYQKEGVYDTGSDYKVDISKIKETYMTERQTKNEKLKNQIAKLKEKGIVEDLQNSWQYTKSPLEDNSSKELLLQYNLKSGEFAYDAPLEQKRASLEKLIKLVARHSQFMLANRVDVGTLLYDRVRKVKEYHELTEKHEDFRADEVRPALLHNQTMLYPEELLEQLMGHYYLGN